MASDFDVAKKLTEQVHKLFLNIENAVQKRKAELLRQIEFLSQQYQMHNINIDCIEKIKILPDNEDDVLNVVKTFGTINFNDFYVDCDLFKVEDYQKPENDHVCLYKCLNEDTSNLDTLIVNVTNLNSTDILSKYSQQQQDDSVDSVDNLSDTKESVDLCKSFTSDSAESNVNVKDSKENCLLKCIERQDPSLCSHFVNTSTNKENMVDSAADSLLLSESLSSENHTQELCSCYKSAFNNSSSISNSIPQKKNTCNECNLTDKKENSLIICNNLVFPKLEEIIIGEDLQKLSVDRVRKLSMEHPVIIQEWMKQIIAEPETEPVQNNEMLEYKQY